MLEVEMKFPVAEFAALEMCLRDQGAQEKASLEEVDHYFNAPDRDFAETDEALRIRSVDSASFVTYKGPKLDQQTKTRTEIEAALGEGAAAAFEQILLHLGYRPAEFVRKRRRVFELNRDPFTVTICLDDVLELGQFAELEIVVPEEQRNAARDTILALAQELGLGPSERRSYLVLLRSKRIEKGK